ncbi:MAG: cytochrome P450 [Thermoanaerobaculia bacterium]
MPERIPPPRLAGSRFSHTQRFMKDPFSLLAEAKERCGDAFSIRLLGLGEWTFLCAPDLLAQLYRAPDDVLAAGEVNRKLLGFMAGSDATFCLDGDAHRDRQRLVLPHLTGKEVCDHTPMIRDLADEMIAGWPLGEPFELLHEIHRLALEVLIRAVFADVGKARCRRLLEVFDTFASRGLRSPLILMPLLQLNLGPKSPWGKILAMQRTLFEEFSREIEERLAAGGEGPGLLCQLIRESRDAGQPLSAESLRDEAISLIFAGHETTALGVAWTVERVLAEPSVRSRLLEELATALDGRPIEASDFRQLPYLAAVVQETLRWRSFAPMASMRRVKKPFPVRDWVVPVGRIVTQGFSVLCQRSETFPDPERVDPGHFFGKQTKRYEWQPFGGGRHMCLGKGLAEVELTVILATLLRKAELRLDQESVKPTREGFFFAPDQGLRVVLEGRR